MKLHGAGLGTLLIAVSVAVAPPAQAKAQAQEEIHSRYFLTSDAARLHYLEAGSGPTIVFVPGYLMPAEVWMAQLRHFAQTHRAVALDPRSQGRSEKVTDGHHLVRRGQDIGELIEHLGEEQAVVVAWSLGVLETLTHVREFGVDSFRALVLVDMSLGFDAPLEEPHPATPFWSGWMKSMQSDRLKWTEKWVRALHASEPSEEYLEDLVEAVMQIPTNTAVTLLANLMLIEERDWRPVLDEMELPFLYLASSQEWARAIAEGVSERWPQGRGAVVEDSGHAAFVDEPERFNQALEEFLASLPDAP